MRTRRTIVMLVIALAACLGVTACRAQQEQEERTEAISELLSKTEMGSVQIVLSDEQITVDGQPVSSDEEDAVYVGADMIFYEEGKGELYGAGSREDEHSREEAQKHTVITITKAGTYVVSGKLSYGQLVIDLGKDAKEDEQAVVHLILNGVELNCEASSAILVLNAYECGDASEEHATPVVDTSNAGFHLYLMENTTNIIHGSYVAKIYKDGTTKEDIENDKAKKKYKFDAAIDSTVSFTIDAGENGVLIVNAENEGISSSLHMTINGGCIEIYASDDAINTNEDGVSVFTMNDGMLTCHSGFGKEGDGIDSNGYITINGGVITSSANAQSMDSGLDSDLGIYINGGTCIASGNMYDEISRESAQLFMTFQFREKVKENEKVMVTDETDHPLFAFIMANDYTVAVYSSPELTEGTYHLYKVSSVTGDWNGGLCTNITDYTDAIQLQTTGMAVMGRPEIPDGERKGRPEMPDGKMKKMPEMPDDRMMDERGKEKMAGAHEEATTELIFNRENFSFGGISEIK